VACLFLQIQNRLFSPHFLNILFMKRIIHIFIFIYLMLAALPGAEAQTPSDAIMMQKGQICFAALYAHESWDEYWEGTLKRSNGNIGTFTRQTFLPMFSLGISDRINVIAALPWVKTEASGGQMRGVSGLQDLGLWVKATALEKVSQSAMFTVHTTLGMTLPTNNYLEDYMPFSLGLGCPDFSARAILQYRLNSGPYLRGQAAYLVRGNAKIERDYYYTTHGVYSDEVDMPNAMSYGATLGSWLFNNSLNADVTFDGLNTFGGHDIRRQDAGFPSNKMEFTRLGLNLHYYLPFVPGLGIVAQGSQVLTGRNFGEATVFTGGLTYQFGLWNNDVEADAAPSN
jgi:hypothetical protein